MPPENDGSSQNEPTPKFVTVDEIGNIVNAAVSSHLKRSLASAIDGALKPHLEKLAAPAAPPPAPTGDEETSAKRSKQSPELLAMAQKVEAMEKALQAEKERVVAAEKKAREERAYTELRSSLEGKVRPEFVDILAKHLFTVEGRVDFDESGNSLFKSTRSLYAGAEPEEVRLPLSAGVEELLKSDFAKPFLPAPSPGAGSTPLPKRGVQETQRGGVDLSKPATTDAEKVRRAIERERIALEQLNKK